MTLRNPSLTVYGVDYPDNIYEIEARKVTPVGDLTTVNVEIVLSVYSDASKTYKFEHATIYFSLTGLPNDCALLNFALYESELQSQHAAEVLDGSAISLFVTV